MESISNACPVNEVFAEQQAGYNTTSKGRDRENVDCVAYNSVQIDYAVAERQIKSSSPKQAVSQAETSTTMYSTSKSKKAYGNVASRKKQNQQQLVNSLKSWNVKIAASGLDKSEEESALETYSSIAPEKRTFRENIANNQNKEQAATRGRKVSISGTLELKETVSDATSVKMVIIQEKKCNQSKQQEPIEKTSTVNRHKEEDADGHRNVYGGEEPSIGAIISSDNENIHAQTANLFIESSSQCCLEEPTMSTDSTRTFGTVRNQVVQPVVSDAPRGNHQKSSSSKGRSSHVCWGWQRQAGSLLKESAKNKNAAGDGQMKDKIKKMIEAIPGQGTGNLKDPPNQFGNQRSGGQNFSPLGSLALHHNQQYPQYPSYIQTEPAQFHHLEHGHSTALNSSENLQEYSLNFLRDGVQKMSLVNDTSNTPAVFNTNAQANYNFTSQFQQQLMQHYHNSHLLHQQNHSTGQVSPIHHQQHQHQHYMHGSQSVYARDDVSCIPSPQNGATGVMVGSKPYSYTFGGSGEAQCASNGNQGFDVPSYVHSRTGNGYHQQNHHDIYYQHHISHNHNQQYQQPMNSYHHNQLNARNGGGIRANQLNYLVNGSGSAHREQGSRNGKKAFWNGNASKGKGIAVQTCGAKHFTKVQNVGFGYRKNLQHFYTHSFGAGHGQFYDHLPTSQQQQPPVLQQHHKQHYLHRNLVYVRENDGGHGRVLPKKYDADTDGGVDVSSQRHAAQSANSCHDQYDVPSTRSIGSVDIEISCADQRRDIMSNCLDDNNLNKEHLSACISSKEAKDVKVEHSTHFESKCALKEPCNVQRSASSSSMVSIPSTESSAMSSTSSQGQILECTITSGHEYDSDSSHSSDYNDVANRFTDFSQISRGQMYRSSSSTSGISSSATNPHSSEFLPSSPTSLRASSAGLNELVVRCHSYHGSHQNLTTYGSVQHIDEANATIGLPTRTLRPVSGTQSVPILGELFAHSKQIRHRKAQSSSSQSSAISLGSNSSLELHASSSSLSAPSVPPNDGQSMQSGHPKKRSQSGRTSPLSTHEANRTAVCFSGHTKGYQPAGALYGLKNNQVSMSYIHRTPMPADLQYTPVDRFILRANDVELKTPLGLLANGTVWDKLSEAIWGKFMVAQQTADKYLQKMQLWRDLYICIKQGFPKYGLYLVGSTISGFGADNSDVDMCLVCRSGSGHYDQRSEALQNLTLVKNYFISMEASSFSQFCLIQAKVPILRFRDSKNGIEVDLNYNNSVGIRNTHLLHCYSQLDWRVRPLVLVVKLWAQHHNINDAKNMTISSYSLVLMVIHFLQYGVKPSVLPCLQSMHPEKFLNIIDINHIEMIEQIDPCQTDNKETLGELLLHFLEYYKDFDYAHYAISVRTGSIIPIDECRLAKSYKNDLHQWKHLCIEEPFDLTNTARSVFDGEVFEKIKDTIVVSWRMLKESKDLNVLFGEPLFTPVTSTLSITS